MKAVRGAEIGLDTLNAPPLSAADVRERLHEQNDRRIFTVYEALKAGVTPDEIFDITKIDRLFLCKLQSLAAVEARLALEALTDELYREAKRRGFTDAAKSEAIDKILEMAEWKKEGRLGGLIVTGCLSER